ncbi:MFS transporter [Streptomyces sp. NPDC050617]|uniref:MFS transporter n=1 Tax=Streptomyces sp. NPDC050617 TaxID=3154628 RepID=UPI00343310F7
MLTGQFMALLDAFIVNVAAPDIRSDLHASGSGLQLVIAGFTIAYAVLLITGARCGDRFGHGRAFMAGLVVFTAASLACGLAGSTGQLIGFRFVQGAGAAVMLPQVLSLIQRTYTGSSRTRALGAYAAVSLAGVGLMLRGGGSGGPGLYAAPAGVGLGVGGAYGPTLTRALAAVRREDAADASGVLVTTAQLGLLAGVAVFGAVFLGGAGAGSPARSSAHALWATALALAGTAAAAAGRAC